MDTPMAPDSLGEHGLTPHSARESVWTWLLLHARAGAAAAVTGLAAVPPIVFRIVTFGATNSTAWFGARCCHVWAKVLCSVFRLKVRVEGRPPAGTFLVASNHLSYLDIVVLGSLYPSVFVAKAEIGRWPFFGWIAKGAGTLFVDRDRPKDVVRAGKEMAEYLAAGIPLTIFPEGRSSRGESVLPFLPSLFEPAARVGVPCYSASLHYESAREEAPPSEAACWHGSTPFVPHLMEVLRHGGIEASVRFSETPIYSHDRKELARRLWGSVNDAFVPIRQRAPSSRCAP